MRAVLSPQTSGTSTLTDCDREPIHIPGAIQSHGALVAFDPDSLEVLQWAGDLALLLGVASADPAGMTIREMLGEAGTKKVLDAVDHIRALPQAQKTYEVEIETAGGLVDALVHPAGPVLILEFERAVRGRGGMHTTLFTLHNMLADVNRATTLADYHAACADRIRAMTGFARVMVYQFLEDGSGTVVAEARDDRMESFLGLRYPESDIPKQARELYRTNWLRCIPDVAYTPQPLRPEINPLTGEPLDLSHSAFRSVSPLHLRYLENMGVAASMSLSIIHRGGLWGLIACHHDEPHYLPCETRAACELFAQVYSLQLESRIHAEAYEYRLQQRSVHQQLVTRLAREESLSDGLIRYRPNLLDLIQADGVAVWIDGEYSEIGHTPGQAGVQSLLRRLDDRDDAGVFATDCLAETFPDRAGIVGEIGGMLALSVSRAAKDYIVWFRREIVETVTWAGNPAKAIETVDGTEKLTPRASFAAWRETVRGRSLPWKPNEIEAVETLRRSILEVVLRRIDEVARERQEAQEKQALLMAELDHRVKNTIANIQSLMRHTRRSETTLDGYVESLEKRIKAMAYAHNLLSQSRWRGAELKALVEDELRPHQSASGAISIEGEPLELRPKAALALSMVFHELTTNAAKYGALSTEGGRLDIRWRVDGDRLRIDWRERGGPPVDPPSRKGFGRTVIEQSLAFELDGEARLRFAPEGVECDLVVPLELVHRSPEAEALDETSSGRQATGRPVRVLIVEDSMITALDVAQTLEDLGFEVLGPTGRVAGALGIIDSATVDVGVLDVNLGKEDSFPIADRLTEQGTPFLFLTGYDAASVLPDRFAGMKCLTKPFSDKALVQAITALSGSD